MRPGTTPVTDSGQYPHHLDGQVQVGAIDKLAHQLLQLENELNSNIPTTLWISDLHGEGDRFKSILRGRFGMLYQTCREALPNTFSSDKIQYLVRIIRKKHYIRDEAIGMDMQDVIFCLVLINPILQNWLLHHILTEDMKFSQLPGKKSGQ